MPDPVLLTADNFRTTPWGGARIPVLKGIEHAGPVGESWEVSLDPALPARTADGRTLTELFREDTGSWLGREAERGGTALMVKLLDARERLSLQVHPIDGDPKLAPGESGKPESWYVIAAEDGAGIFIGFKGGVSARDAREAAHTGNFEPLLNFVPVVPGDFFVIEAGTPHAIGEGVMVVEPQYVVPGAHGLTYRFWDWGRRFDDDGNEDPSGQPRALHFERALEVTEWGGVSMERMHTRAPTSTEGAAELVELCGPQGHVASQFLRVRRILGNGEVCVPTHGHVCALTVVGGRVDLPGGVTVETGQTALIPASPAECRCFATRGHAVVSSVLSTAQGS